VILKSISFLEEHKNDKIVTLVRLGIEFLELELNSYSNCEFQGKKLSLGVEFFRLENIIFNGKK
jgi:hypothetical protein